MISTTSWIGVTAILVAITTTSLPFCHGFAPSVLWSVRYGSGTQHPSGVPESRRSMVSTSTSSSSSPVPKYPVQRGEELDSRKIVKSARQHLTAIRLNHILFASEEMALQTLHELRMAALAFDELAFQVSNCPITREERGHVGWVSVLEDDESNKNNDDDDSTTNNDHLDLILPPDARKKVVRMNTKVSENVVVVVLVVAEGEPTA